MIEYIYVGKIVNTHSLKGEVRVLTKFEYKSLVFKSLNNLYIGSDKIKETIESVRPHKQFILVKFKGINDILDVIKYKGCNIYYNKLELNLNSDELLSEELIGIEISFNNKIIGKVTEYRNDNDNKMIKVSNKYIPYNRDFIDKIDKEKRIIYYKNIDYFI